MRLYEIETKSMLPILKVLQGLAAKQNDKGAIPFPVVMGHLKSFDLPVGGLESDRQKMMTAIKNEIDPEGNIIKTVNADGSIVLNVPKDPQQAVAAKTPGPDIDQMAKQGARARPVALNRLAAGGAKNL